MSAPLRTGLGFACAVVLLQLLAVLNPAVVEVDVEEMYNASHALELTRGHLSEAFLLQYRPFCGGCTLDALLGAAVFAVLPPSWLAWKLVPTGLLALLTLAAVATFSRRQGAAAGWMIGALFLLPAYSFAALALIAWGNHYECGVIVALAALLLSGRLRPGRLLVAGVLLSGGVWVGFSALFALPAAGVWLLWRRQEVGRGGLAALVVGLLIGAAPVLAQAVLTGSGPVGEIYGGGEGRPRLSHIPTQTLTLLHPRQLAGLLGAPGVPAAAVGTVLSAIAAAVIVLRQRIALGRLCLLLLASWTGTYLLSGFHIPIPPAPQIPTPAALRYLIPAYPMLLLLIASAAADQRQDRPWLSGLLLAGPLAAGLISRVVIFSGPFPIWNAATMAAADHDYFRQQASYLLPADVHRQCTAEAPVSQDLHAYALGWRETETALSRRPDPSSVLPTLRPHTAREAWFGGAAVAAIDRLDPEGRGGLLSFTTIRDAGWPDAALRTALLTRQHGSAPWLAAIEGHDESSLRRLDGVLAESPLVEEAWWLAGIRWGGDTSQWLIPSPFALPIIPDDLDIPDSFAAGLGEALGERWGPLAAIPCPENLPLDWEAAFLDGYQLGWQKRWIRRSPGAAGTGACTPPTSATR